MNLSSYIISAASVPVAYSTEFSERVAALGRELSVVLGLPVRHDADMNYRAGQSLEFELQMHSPQRRKAVLIEVRVYVSAKAALFGLLCLDRKRGFIRPDQIGDQVSCKILSGESGSAIEKVRQFFIQKGFQEVDEELFQVKVPGALTELDGLPATVFEALFAEIT